MMFLKTYILLFCLITWAWAQSGEEDDTITVKIRKPTKPQKGCTLKLSGKHLILYDVSLKMLPMMQTYLKQISKIDKTATLSTILHYCGVALPKVMLKLTQQDFSCNNLIRLKEELIQRKDIVVKRRKHLSSCSKQKSF